MASGDAGLLKWVTLFDKNNEERNSDQIDIPDVPEDDLDLPAPSGKSKGGKKGSRLSVERIYQKKTQLEHILLRPDTYIGSVELVTQPMWVYDDMNNIMQLREISFVPGLYKIFDEILVNAADNKQRDQNMNCIRIDIDPEANKIKIWNNGKGIPVVEHQKEKMYVPTLIFGVLLTSSNYNDDQKKVTGGRNGYGAKLCNVFSTKFVVETQSNDEKKAFRQTWTDNMGKTSEPKITAARGEDFTCVTFHPDLQKFKMERLDKDIVDLFTRRAYDIAASAKGVRVFLNGKRVAVKNFKDFIELYVKDKVDENGQPIKLVHEVVSDRWEIAVCLSEKGYQQVSFVNSIATTKGGRHVDYITDQLVNKMIDVVKKKEKKGGFNIKPFQVKSHLWVFVNCLIENPTFDSQTKENMTLQVKSFGSKCLIPEKFITMASRCGIVEAIQSWMKFKAQAQLNKKSGAKTSKLKGIPKLDDANDAGTKHSADCTLILTEGDSAKALAVAGLAVVGRDRYGVFPLKGKVLNVREATHKQIMENAEINNLIKIFGLRYKEKYETVETMKTLRYGKMMIMTDQDQDGSHIKGLLINFIHHNWPNLLKHGFLEEFITPIVKVTKSKQEKSFYSLPEFEEWKQNTENWHTYKVKYYKGLGTSTAKEAKDYFSDMERHRIPFRYNGLDDDACILLAFSKKKIEERKEWLTNWMDERKRRMQLGLPELYLYGKETKDITYNEFVNRELILFSNMDNERSIPSLVDGLKPGQRKVLFTCFKRNLTKELKVAQLAGSVAEMSAYHHGEMSLMSTIVNLAQNFVGSNNINLLQPIGQFGTRLHGGKDAASPRYIFTALSRVARHLFNVNDDPLLNNLYDDNQKIEPEYYVPIIPMVLVNGAEGIGTGWSTKLPNHDPREIVLNIKRMLEGREPKPMLPSYKGFGGVIEDIDGSRFAVSGEVAVLDDNLIEITELPIKTWTQAYKETTLETMLQGTEKVPSLITDYKEYHTDSTVRFTIKMSEEKLAHSEHTGLHKVFKLQSVITTSSMVLFDANGCIKRYDSVLEVLREFYTLRLDFYQRRKDYLEGMLGAESVKLDNQARFICEKIDNIISIENKPKKELIQMLVRRGYESDPVKAWKTAQEKLRKLDHDSDGDGDEEDGSGADFNYILNMSLWCLSKEKKEQLLKQRDDKAEELYQLRKKTKEDLWKDDLEAFLKELDAVEKEEREDAASTVSVVTKTVKGRTQKKKITAAETKPSMHGRRVEPYIDPTLRAKAEAAAKARRKKEQKKETGIGLDGDLDGMDNDEDEEDSKGLFDRIAGDKTALKKEPAAVKDPKQRSIFDVMSTSTTKSSQKSTLAESTKGEYLTSDSKDDGHDSESLTKSSQAIVKPSRVSGVIDDDDDDDEGSKGLFDRIVGAKTSLKKDAGPVDKPKRVRKPSSGVKREKKESAGKKTKSRKPWSDSEGSKDSDSECDAYIPPERASPRRAKASKVKYTFSDDENDKDDTSSESGSTGTGLKDALANGGGKQSDDGSSNPKTSPIREVAFSDSDSDTGITESTQSTMSQPSNSRPKSPIFSVDDSDEEPIFSPKPAAPVKKPEPAKKPRATKKTAAVKDPKQRSIFDVMSTSTTKSSQKSTLAESTKGEYLTSDSKDEGHDSESLTKSSQAIVKPSRVSGDQPPKKKKAAPKRKILSDISDLSDDESVQSKPAPKKKGRAKKDDSDMSDEDFGMKEMSKKPPGISDDDDWDAIMATGPKRSTAAARPKRKVSSDEDDSIIEPRSRGGGRSRKPVKYNFGEESDESDFD